MTTALRPMTTGEILDRTFNLYRSHFVLFVGIATLPPALLLLVNLLQTGMVASPGRASSLQPALMLAGGIGLMSGGIAYMVGLAIAQAATIFAVSAVHLGRPTTIGDSYRRVKGRFGRVLNVVFSVAIRVFGGTFLLVVGAAMIFTLIPGAGRSAGTAGAIAVGLVGVVAVIAAVIVAIGLFVRYSLAVQACVLEDIKAREALKRSVLLARGSRGRILAVYFLMIVLNYIVMFAFVLPISMLGALAKSSPVLFQMLSHLATFVAGALVGPVATIAMSLVYYDERVRKEAFDIQLMVAALDGTPPPAAAAGAATTA